MHAYNLLIIDVWLLPSSCLTFTTLNALLRQAASINLASLATPLTLITLAIHVTLITLAIHVTLITLAIHVTLITLAIHVTLITLHVLPAKLGNPSNSLPNS
jgi:hypothetical protein